MNLIDKLSVIIGGRKVGTLTMTPDKRLCAFEYDKDWLADGFSISPFELPLKQGVFIAKPTPFFGDFGIFEDSLPDGYGRYLLNRMLRKQKIFSTLPAILHRVLGKWKKCSGGWFSMLPPKTKTTILKILLLYVVAENGLWHPLMI